MVVSNGVWSCNSKEGNQEKNMTPLGVLICHENSYPFQERTLCLEHPIKIGRSVARARAAVDNAIFDCKVLSRNHALLWYESCKFFIKDTKSSNGTFVNNKRLSMSGEESLAYEVSSGDIVQFGVDVVESTKKVTHGCIVASLKLYFPDGKEAKTTPVNSVSYINVALDDLYRLNQYIQEAKRREQVINSKLEYMQQLVQHIKLSASQSWKALVLEDILLSRLDMLESQVKVYSKNFSESRIKKELITLLEDKAKYQNATKDLLQKKLKDKQDILREFQTLKCHLHKKESETQCLHNIIQRNQIELQNIAVKYIKVQQVLQITKDELIYTKQQLQKVSEDKQNVVNQFDIEKSSQYSGFKNLIYSKIDKINIYKHITAIHNYMQTLQDIKCALNVVNLHSKKIPNPIDLIDVILKKWNSLCMDFPFDAYSKENSINIWNQDLFLETAVEHFVNTSGSNLDKSNRLKSESEILCAAYDHYHNKKYYDVSNESRSSRKPLPLLTQPRLGLCNITTDSNVKVLLLLIKHFNHINFKHGRISNNNYNLMSEEIIPTIQHIFKTPIVEIGSTELFHIDALQGKESKALTEKHTSSSNQNSDLNTYIYKKYKRFRSESFVLTSMLPFYTGTRKSEQLHIEREIDDLIKWIFSEINNTSLQSLKIHCGESKNENCKIKELGEQLTVFKEKYYMTFEQKQNILKKYNQLESVYKNFKYNSFMVPVYYIIAPIILLIMWKLLEKLF